MFKFKEPAVFVGGGQGGMINYHAIDPLHDRKTNKLFHNTEIVDGNLIGNYTGELKLTPYNEPPETLTFRTLLTTDEFIEQIPPDEFLALRAKRDTNGLVAMGWYMVMSRNEIDVSSERVRKLLQGIVVSSETLSQKTVTRILQGVPNGDS